MYKVLIVDDHESVCDSLERTLASAGDFSVVGRLPNAADAEIYCEKFRPDLVFMDICTESGASGLDAIKVLNKKFPELKIIAMSGFDEITYAPRAKEAGARAFLHKSQSLDYFIEAARGVMRGNCFYPETKKILMPDGECPLTSRELQVLKLVCKHMTNTEIAAELNISDNTVKFHKKNMLEKTGFANCVDLAFHVISHGWINPLF